MKARLERHKTWTRLLFQLSEVLILKNEAMVILHAASNQKKLYLQAQYCNIEYHGLFNVIGWGWGWKGVCNFYKNLTWNVIFVHCYRCSIAIISYSQNTLDWKHTLKFKLGQCCLSLRHTTVWGFKCLESLPFMLHSF